jgi:tRNA (guanine-N7-)-methyltransferase
MAKNKLKRFADMANYPNVTEPLFEEVFRKDYRTKGNWGKDIFGNSHPIVLELGCGKGEYTVALARQFPAKNFIGVDIKGSRMWVGASDALQSRLTNVAFLRTRIEFIQSCFADDEVSEIWITFPDPQPQQSRANKRLTSTRFLESYRNILRQGGSIHLKTDSQSLFDYTCRLINHNKLPLQACTDDLYHSEVTGPVLSVQTYYEKIFMAKNLPIKYIRFTVPDGQHLLC